MKDFPRRQGTGENDQLLTALLNVLGSSVSAFSIVALTQGGVIHGTVIPRDEWLKLWLDTLRKSGTAGNLLADAFDLVREESGVVLLDNDLDGDSPTYLHLKDAHITTGSRQFNNNPLLLRVRVATINGWSLGGTPEDED